MTGRRPQPRRGGPKAPAKEWQPPRLPKMPGMDSAMLERLRGRAV